MRNDYDYDYESRRSGNGGYSSRRDQSSQSTGEYAGGGSRGRYYGGQRREMDDRPDRWNEGGYEDRGNRDYESQYEGRYSSGESGRNYGEETYGASRGMGDFGWQSGGRQFYDRDSGRQSRGGEPWGSEGRRGYGGQYGGMG